VGIAARLFVIGVLAALLGGSGNAALSVTGHPLQTAVVDPFEFPATATSATAFARVQEAGGTAVRLIVRLDAIAPNGTTRPPGFDATNPADPAYDWSNIDDQVGKAVAAGLEPILCLYGLPQWARDPAGPPFTRPSSTWFGKFAEGAARRYSGTFGTLPRVRYWQAWNEPNLGPNLEPLRIGSTLVAPRLYRRLVNSFSDGVKQVHADNAVIAGGLAPYEAPPSNGGIPPLTFMKDFLCMTGMQIRPRPRCLERATFDIWAAQPYTWGGPTHHSSQEGDVQLGDLPSMKAALDQAIAERRIVSEQDVRFWVTEFSWDTNPPDPGGLSPELHARWVAHALYAMWQNGVSLVTWWLVRDRPAPERWQSGLYFAQDTPKQFLLDVFRFPMVAFVESGQIRVWCRTPGGTSGAVVFELNDGSGVWSALPSGFMSTDSHGIATAVLPSPSLQGEVRATFLNTGEQSVPFSLTEVPDQPIDPFGH
jgi:hypothetical protein